MVNLTIQNAFEYLRGSPGSATMAIVDNDTLIWLIDPIPPVFVNENAPDSTIDLIPVFFPSEEVAQFEVASSVPGLVMAQLVGSDLILDYAPNTTGSATVTVTAFDRNENRVSTSFEVGVYPLTSVAATGLPEVGVGADYELSLDPGTEDVIDWTVDWGDGTSSTVGGGTVPVLAFHQYLTEGDFVVAATAMTPIGGPALAIPLLLKALDARTNPDMWRVEGKRLAEGNAGQTAFEFKVKMLAAAGREIKMKYRTVEGTATVADFAAVSGELTFAPGETEKTVTVQVNGDATVEPDEEFFLALELPAFMNGKPTSLRTPFGRGFIQNDDGLPANDPWASWMNVLLPETPDTVKQFPLGEWRKTVDGTTTTMTTPQGPGWSRSMTGEGPYLKYNGGSNPNAIASFRLTLEWKAKDAQTVPPAPNGTARPAQQQHYSNSGVYIYNRYEVQIVDPSKFTAGIKDGVITDVKDKDGKIVEEKDQLLPGGLYGTPNRSVPPAKSYTNRAKPTGEWNKMVVEFSPGTVHPTDNKNLSVPAFLRVKFIDGPNTFLVYESELQVNMFNLTGTGGRSNPEKFKPLASGSIFLQSHWGSQVEFRNPVVDEVPITRTPTPS